MNTISLFEKKRLSESDNIGLFESILGQPLSKNIFKSPQIYCFSQHHTLSNRTPANQQIFHRFNIFW
jgi:hypothetical protein